MLSPGGIKSPFYYPCSHCGSHWLASFWFSDAHKGHDGENAAPGGAEGSGRSSARDGEGVPLSDWEIREQDIEICRRQDGNLWHLGAGSHAPCPAPSRSDA